jgi:hypothetical protein
MATINQKAYAAKKASKNVKKIKKKKPGTRARNKKR